MDAAQLKYLFLQRYKGQLSTEEALSFDAYTRDPANEESIKSCIEDLLREPPEEIPLAAPAVFGEIFQRVVAPSVPAKMPVTAAIPDASGSIARPAVMARFLPLRWVAAATILAVVIGAGYLHLTRHETPAAPDITVQPKPKVPDAAPGGNRAILTLADGHTIDLDSTHGTIVKAGAMSINNSQGQLNYQGRAGGVEWHTLSTPRGGQYRLELPDGTAVWLNAESSIRYPTAFNDRERKVELKGEAFFEVARDAARSFVVDVAGSGSITVLGTSFNVNAYAEVRGARTTLLEGRVKVTAASFTQVLQPGEQATPRGAGYVVRKLDEESIDKVMAWKNGLFNFDGMKMQDVMQQLSRWYDIEIIYQGNVPNKEFYGQLSRNKNLSSLLAALKDVGVHFRIEDKKLIVLP